MECWRKAAEQGHAEAQWKLGVVYYLGIEWRRTMRWRRSGGGRQQPSKDMLEHNFLKTPLGWRPCIRLKKLAVVSQAIKPFENSPFHDGCVCIDYRTGTTATYEY